VNSPSPKRSIKSEIPAATIIPHVDGDISSYRFRVYTRPVYQNLRLKWMKTLSLFFIHIRLPIDNFWEVMGRILKKELRNY
jgi:hypothetical protein